MREVLGSIPRTALFVFVCKRPHASPANLAISAQECLTPNNIDAVGAIGGTSWQLQRAKQLNTFAFHTYALQVEKPTMQSRSPLRRIGRAPYWCKCKRSKHCKIPPANSKRAAQWEAWPRSQSCSALTQLGKDHMRASLPHHTSDMCLKLMAS